MKLLTTKEASQILNVSPWMVLLYVKGEMITASTRSGKKGNGQRHYFDPAEIAAFSKGGAPAAKAYREQQADALIKPRKGRRRPQTV